MKKSVILLICLAFLVSAGTLRTGGTGIGHNPPGVVRGSYTVVNVFAGGLDGAYGLAIQDNVPNSIWIMEWDVLMNREYDMSTGSATGTEWAIDGGVDPDDSGYCEYTAGNQWFMTDYSASFFAVFAEDGTWLRNIDGPAGYTNLFGVGAGHDMIYLGSPNETMLAWGPYTGVETSITAWSEMSYESVYGLAVWGDYLFVACGLPAVDNLFIHSINPDGSPNPTPEWSCMFEEEVEANGGIDFDGTYLWVYPQNSFLYQLDIDWEPGALDQSTWGGIKAIF